MKRSIYLVFITLGVFINLFFLSVQAQQVTTMSVKSSGLAFIENAGQWNDSILFKAEIMGGAVFLTPDGFRFNYYAQEDVLRIHDLKVSGEANVWEQEEVRHHAYSVALEGMQLAPGKVKGMGRQNTYYNYFLGNEKENWKGKVALYDSVSYKNVYQDIDLLIYSEGLQLKYDFLVRPGADAAFIRFNYKGVQPQLQKDGSLKILTSVNEVVELKPYVYQMIQGQKVTVSCNYRWNSKKSQLSFDFPNGYNQQYDLVIDPLLVFATLSGGTAETFGFSATYDREGNYFAGGQCYKPGWPTTTGAFQTKFIAGVDVSISKYNAQGNALLYSTYFGGSGAEEPNSMVVSSQNELLVTGSTSSKNLPFTSGCWDSTLNGYDIYIAKFNADGTALVGATFLGGNSVDGLEGSSFSSLQGDNHKGEIWVDSSDNIYIASYTYSDDYPVTANALQQKFGGKLDGCFSMLDPYCKKLIYSTYIGGEGMDVCFSFVHAAKDDFYATGTTSSKNFPVSPSAHQTQLRGNKDAYVLHFSIKDGLIASTYLGTDSSDLSYKIQLDNEGHPWVMGRTTSPDYPVSPGVVFAEKGLLFMQQLSSDLKKTLMATKFAARPDPTPISFMIDQCGKLYLSCVTTDSVMPLSKDALASYDQDLGVTAFWLGVFNPDFKSLYYGTYYKGVNHSDGGTSRYDPYGIVYHTSCICNRSFETTPGAYGHYFTGTARCDCGSFKFNFESVKPRASFSFSPGLRDTGCLPYAVGLVNKSELAMRYFWDFGDGFTSRQKEPAHTYTKAGVYTITLVGYNDTMCATLDTFRKKIWVIDVDLPIVTLGDTTVCISSPFYPNVAIVNPQSTATYQWEPATHIKNGANTLNPLLDPLRQRQFILTITNSVNGCTKSKQDTLDIQVFDPGFYQLNVDDTLLCAGDSVLLTLVTTDTVSHYTWSPSLFLSAPDSNTTYVWPSKSGNYTVSVINDFCPSLHYTASVKVDPRPKIILGGDTSICWNQDLQLFAAVTPASYEKYTYAWTPADYVDDAQSPYPYLIKKETVSLEVKVNTPGGCVASEQLRITVHPAFALSVNTRDTGLCPGDSLLLAASGAPYYQWRPNVKISDTVGASVWVAPRQSEIYTLIGRAEQGCSDSLTVNVQVYSGAVLAMPEQVKIWEGEYYDIQPETNCTYFEWFPGSGLDNSFSATPRAQPEVRTRYFVTAITESGCSLKDSIDILVEKEAVLDMPNAFHPGSGQNAFLKPIKRGWVNLKYFQVYNRWGQLVFETNDIEKGWDGRYKGAAQTMGVYLYRIEAVTKTRSLFQKSGNVTLMR